MSQKIKITITFIYIVHYVATIASECGVPDTFENGHIEVIGNNKIKYVCFPGYHLFGKSIRYCTRGRWEGSNPKCLPRNCGNPGEILNGYYEATSVTLGSTVTFSCDPGYRLVGTPNRICEASGWSGRVPECEVVTCNDLEPIKNGRTPIPSYKEFWENGMVARFSCIGDYALIGAEELICTETGNWNKPPPICKAVQCNRPKLTDGMIIAAGFGPTYKFRETITYRCEHGYKMFGVSIIECTEDNNFLPPPPSCNFTGCKRPEFFTNGYMEKDRPTYEFNENIKFKCNSGYKLKGSSLIQCKNNNVFVPKPPVCEEVTCEAPSSFRNGRRISLQYTYHVGESATFKCFPGFMPLEEISVTCNKYGIFQPPIPTCQRVTCEAPPSFRNGRRTSLQYSYAVGESATFKCSSGFTPLDEISVTCNKYGKFEPPIPTCQRGTPGTLLKDLVSLLCDIIATKTNSIQTDRDLLRLEEENLQAHKTLKQKVEAILKYSKTSEL